jgi:hypothetical protein
MNIKDGNWKVLSVTFSNFCSHKLCKFWGQNFFLEKKKKKNPLEKDPFELFQGSSTVNLLDIKISMHICIYIHKYLDVIR